TRLRPRAVGARCAGRRHPSQARSRRAPRSVETPGATAVVPRHGSQPSPSSRRLRSFAPWVRQAVRLRMYPTAGLGANATHLDVDAVRRAAYASGMDLVEHYAVMARYNAWMNRKLYDAAATLPDDERRRDLGAFFHSLHGTLNHLVLTDRAWLVRFANVPGLFQALDGTMPEFSGRLDQELYADFATRRRLRAN